MPAAGRYPLPTEPNPEIRRLDARDLPAAVVADGAEAVAALLPAGPARDAVLDTLHAVRPDVLAELRRREAARQVAEDLAAGYGRKAARHRAAAAVGVSEWTVRVTWGLPAGGGEVPGEISTGTTGHRAGTTG